MYKSIVTGGAGFIGSHLTEALARRGDRVTVIDDLSTGKETNLAAALRNSNVEFIRGSVTDPTLIEKSFQGADYVFHLAAAISVPESLKDPRPYHDTNVTGTLNVLLAARNNRARKVVYASSASVYGDASSLPQKEDAVPDPRSLYALTKLTGESYCAFFERIYGLPTICLRYFNVYGPGQDADSACAAVIPKFISVVLQEQPLTVYGNGEQTRDFVFVEDVVRANILAAGGEAGGVYNVASGTGTSIKGLIEAIFSLSGRKTPVIYNAERPGDVKHSVADISKAQAFGYKPEYDLKSGLAITIESHR